MAGDSEETADDELGRICRVSVVMLKTVRNRDIDFNALLSKVGQSLVAARVGGVMTSAIIRGVHPRFLYAMLQSNRANKEGRNQSTGAIHFVR